MQNVTLCTQVLSFSPFRPTFTKLSGTHQPHWPLRTELGHWLCPPVSSVFCSVLIETEISSSSSSSTHFQLLSYIFHSSFVPISDVYAFVHQCFHLLSFLSTHEVKYIIKHYPLGWKTLIGDGGVTFTEWVDYWSRVFRKEGCKWMEIQKVSGCATILNSGGKEGWLIE